MTSIFISSDKGFDSYGTLCKVMDIVLHQMPSGRKVNLLTGSENAIWKLLTSYAMNHSLSIEGHSAHATQFGTDAKRIRDKALIDTCNLVVAFWDHHDTDLKIVLEMAVFADKPVVVCYYNTQQILTPLEFWPEVL